MGRKKKHVNLLQCLQFCCYHSEHASVSTILESVDLILQHMASRHSSSQDQGAHGTCEMNTLTSSISRRRNSINRDMSTFIQCLERSILLAYKVLELITDLEIKRWHSLRFITPIALMKSRKNLSASFAGNKTEQLPSPPPWHLDITKTERGTRQNERIQTSSDFISLVKQAVYSI